jgi:hypothetical protein
VHISRRLLHWCFRFTIERKDSKRTGVACGAGDHGELSRLSARADGRISAGADLECADDAEAVEAAKRLVGEYAVELWQGTRMVARLEVPPTRAP